MTGNKDSAIAKISNVHLDVGVEKEALISRSAI
jgi:D-arabinose 5-phosphate isomerase GutQ